MIVSSARVMARSSQLDCAACSTAALRFQRDIIQVLAATAKSLKVAGPSTVQVLATTV
jgi:hypothetical protein